MVLPKVPAAPAPPPRPWPTNAPSRTLRVRRENLALIVWFLGLGF